MKWISVKDQKPEFGVPVFVCEEDKEDTVNICRLNSITLSKDHEGMEWYEGRTSYEPWYHEVTHWSPIRFKTTNQ